jgi:hypothetical protein
VAWEWSREPFRACVFALASWSGVVGAEFSECVWSVLLACEWRVVGDAFDECLFASSRSGVVSFGCVLRASSSIKLARSVWSVERRELAYWKHRFSR